MKILSISNCPLVATQGSGYIITGFSERLRARGHEVDLFGPETFEPLAQFKGRARSYRQSLGMWNFCRRQLRRKKYDVVELWGGEAWLTTTLLSYRAKRPLLISHSNGLETHYFEVKNANPTNARRWYQLDQSKLMRRAFTLCDGLVTVSHYDGDYALEREYQTPERIVTIENSLTSEFLALTVDWERAPIVGFCGSWLANKGTAAMREALTQLLQQSPHVRLLLIGVGTLFDVCREFPNVHEQIEVVPFVNDKNELRQLYQSMAVLMLPSFYESFGLVAAEAMACGCALVATRTGLAASLVDGKQALLINEPAPEALRAALQKLLTNETLRRSIAQAGYKRAQTLNWDEAVKTLESTYLKWLAERA